jgi:hypothetical protein
MILSWRMSRYQEVTKGPRRWPVRSRSLRDPRGRGELAPPATFRPCRDPRTRGRMAPALAGKTSSAPHPRADVDRPPVGRSQLLDSTCGDPAMVGPGERRRPWRAAAGERRRPWRAAAALASAGGRCERRRPWRAAAALARPWRAAAASGRVVRSPGERSDAAGREIRLAPSVVPRLALHDEVAQELVGSDGNAFRGDPQLELAAPRRRWSPRGGPGRRAGPQLAQRGRLAVAVPRGATRGGLSPVET